MTLCRKNMVAYQISTILQSTTEILLTNGRHIEILLPDLILTFSLSFACDSALDYQILCKLDDRRRSDAVILVLQDDGNSVADLLPVSGLATSHI